MSEYVGVKEGHSQLIFEGKGLDGVKEGHSQLIFEGKGQGGVKEGDTANI